MSLSAPPLLPPPPPPPVRDQQLQLYGARAAGTAASENAASLLCQKITEYVKK